MYKMYFKRLLDIVISLLGIIILLPFFILFSIVGLFVMKGNPYFFQLRPGKDGRVFKLIKFRSMSELKDKEGNYLPDKDRLTNYGEWLRSTSIDETLEIINILKGDMSFVGPRPFLVKDYVFMDDETKLRHSVRPGLTGLAQVNGRNNMLWEDKFKFDAEYIKNISLKLDLQIFIKTVLKVIGVIKMNDDEVDISEDYGDYLLNNKKISEADYSIKIEEAKTICLKYEK